MERVTIENLKKTALTENEMNQVTGGGGGVPGSSKIAIGDGSVRPYLAVELENVQITSYQLG